HTGSSPSRQQKRQEHWRPLETRCLARGPFPIVPILHYASPSLERQTREADFWGGAGIAESRFDARKPGRKQWRKRPHTRCVAPAEVGTDDQAAAGAPAAGPGGDGRKILRLLPGRLWARRPPPPLIRRASSRSPRARVRPPPLFSRSCFERCGRR